ncbi:MFS transporter [Streptomyces sp. MNU77]|nr:MFS transporter [Streptomyces sp. MNU77]
MGRAQTAAIACAFFALTIDGFDVFVMGFLVPYLPDGFVENDTQRGLLLSAGVFGMAAGALLLAPLADRVGRRRVILTLTSSAALGMLLCGLCADYTQLFVARVFTGLSIGAMAPALTLLVQELSNDRRRTSVFGLFTIAWPVGTLLSGLFSVGLMDRFDDNWRAMFFFGAALGALCALISFFTLPESPEFLLARRPDRFQERLDAVIDKLRLAGVDRLARPAVSEKQADAGGVRGLLGPTTRGPALVVVFLYSVTVFAVYWVTTWTPQIVAEESGSAHAGSVAGTILGLGTVTGAVVFALYSVRFSPFKVHGLVLVLSAASFIGVTLTFQAAGAALVLTALGGLFLQFGIIGFPATVVYLFPVRSRVTVLGAQNFVSRTFGVLAPAAAGALLSFMRPTTLFALAAVPITLASLGGLYLWSRMKRLVPREVPAEGAAVVDAAPARGRTGAQVDKAATDLDPAAG